MFNLVGTAASREVGGTLDTEVKKVADLEHWAYRWRESGNPLGVSP